MKKKTEESQDRKQESLEKMKLSRTISDWALKNKKVFWKYEVSCFHKTYALRISNLPEPNAADISPVSVTRLLSEQQKKQLCDAITKSCTSLKVFNDSVIDVQIDYDNGSVIAEVI